MSKTRAIVMPAGKNSLHKNWFTNSSRSFDIITLVYDDSFDDHASCADISFRKDGFKTQLLGWFFETQQQIWENYEYFWLADDDLAIDVTDINRMFDLAEQWGMRVAQPSLTHDSPHSFDMTLHQKSFQYRVVSFVEIMCPLFRKDALEQVIPYFKESESAWGVDEIWSQILFRDEPKYIIDAIQVHHTKEIGKPKRGEHPSQGKGFYSKLSKNPYDELYEMADKFGFKAGKKKRSLGAVDLHGNKLGRWRTNRIIKKDRASD
jgi:hypothetical protein